MSDKPGRTPPPPGLTCPRCECPDLRVVKTLRLPGSRIRRYRQCQHCGRRVITLERQAGK